MAQHTLNWVEKKEYNGTPLLEVTLADGKKATIWKVDKEGKEFPGFDAIAPGHTIEGELWNKPGTDKWTIYPPKAPSAPRSNGGSMRGVAAAQERKSEYIKEAQERKEESIAYFNATNSAIQLLTSNPRFQEMTPEDKKDNIIWWREFFLSEWRKYDAKPEQDKHIPF